MNMKVERVGVDKVRERLQGLKKATSQPITSMGINLSIFKK